jgi:hypothetical protein
MHDGFDAPKTIEWQDVRILEALEQLRECPGGREVVQQIGSEYLAASFLAANDYNVEVALGCLQETAVWRESEGAAAVRVKIIETGLKSFSDLPHFDRFSKYFPQCQGGKAMDKRGLPYSIRCIGRADVEQLFEALSEEHISELQLFTQEMRLLVLESYAHRTGLLGNVKMVQDLYCPTGLWNQFVTNRDRMSFMKKISYRIDTHYPGLLGEVFLVNAPWAVHAILSIIRPLLPARLMGRVEIVPAELVPERLLEDFDAEALPQFLGGSGADEEFIPGHRLNTNEADDGDSLLVNAGCEERCSIDLAAGDSVGFGMRVDGSEQDILFSCHFESADDPESNEVVRSSSRIAEDNDGNNFVAPSKGTFVMVFDNSYSWIYSKTIRYELFKMESSISPDAINSIGAPEDS